MWERGNDAATLDAGSVYFGTRLSALAGLTCDPAAGSSVVRGVNEFPVCNYADSYFQFNAANAGGKGLQATLLLAQATGQIIDVWFTPMPPNSNGSCQPYRVLGIGIGSKL